MDAALPSPDLPLSHVAFVTETLGDIAQAVGTPQFMRAVYDTLVRYADFDAVHLDYERVASSGQRSVGWIGSFGREPELVTQVMRHYYRSYASDDATYAAIDSESDMQLVQVSAQRVASEIRHQFFDSGDIHDECVIAGVTLGTRYSISIARSRRLPPFSLKELSLLKQLSQVVLPLASAHKRLLGAISADDAPRDELDLDLVAQWLPEWQERLTAREMHVCASFIQGMTSAAIAQSMGLKTSTVDTYAKRAFAKLGVDSRRQLMTLVLRNASRRHAA
ncbi:MULTISPECIES: helix-turn-helix transcriptional regulator [Burkholderia]|uniref:helix-turn-helix transcriptional regulator n=1 Tax=Burkholderia TaxID=32008 RepID=UPI000B7AAB6A|nr:MULTISPECIES: helix-turn-helix transcriptional regulator [Burkholderia]MBY4724725.1 helix-turn-helix transcriptional regulator [Burkholderia contaminans]MCI3974539.1 helix-turn-helix transcriptional regulator [Burkholderia sp. HI4860]MDN7789128.1 helix-turn-helix transcriptional regulator [Burkholderia contaminans]OXI94142.1 helix-turn-helix transcriptional regulator [Burkholderia sp. AU33647]